MVERIKKIWYNRHSK